MFVVICKSKVKPEKIETYETTFRELREKVLANEPGVTFYELCRVPGEPGSYRVVECYKDQQTQDEHLAMDYYQAAFATVLDCLVDGAFEMEVVEPV